MVETRTHYAPNAVHVSDVTPAEIRALRRRLGLTWEEFGERFACSAEAIKHWLKRERRCTGESAERIDCARVRYGMIKRPHAN